jgi:polyhydroxyalkanoate synthase subunit PhaC
MTWLSSAAALPHWRSASGASNPGWAPFQGWAPALRPQAQALADAFAAADPDAARIAVGREVRRRLGDLVEGVASYRHHPYARASSAAPVVWHAGTTRLLDYSAPGATGLPVLVVPSLVNRAYIVDLLPERSFMRFLSQAGFRPYLVDWDRPGEAERQFDLSGYIDGRLSTILDQVRLRTGAAPALIGYCMGGLLTLALAQLRPRDIARLVLLATPWDFHAERGDQARLMPHLAGPWLPLMDQLGELPVDALQAMFFGLDPFMVIRKFCAFARLDPGSARAREFVALEDWLNDGVPLAAPVARDCVLGWYGDNTPARGVWQVAGHAIQPRDVAVPTLVVVPEQDRIVPPASALVLGREIPQAATMSVPLGHIGMVSSGRATDQLWQRLGAWLAAGGSARHNASERGSANEP